jgi:hypothetical protein
MIGYDGAQALSPQAVVGRHSETLPAERSSVRSPACAPYPSGMNQGAERPDDVEFLSGPDGLFPYFGVRSAVADE